MIAYVAKKKLTTVDQYAAPKGIICKKHILTDNPQFCSTLCIAIALIVRLSHKG